MLHPTVGPQVVKEVAGFCSVLHCALSLMSLTWCIFCQ